MRRTAYTLLIATVLLGPLAACSEAKSPGAATAAGPAKVDPKIIIREPQWTQRPTPAQIAQLKPAASADFKLSAVASLWCVAQADGSLGACQIDWQDPPGMGFGEAAMKAAPLFRMAPSDRLGSIEGRPVQAQINWPKPG